jgi:hypothetical protein
MSNFVKIEGKDSLVRDMATGAIINTSRTDYENYLNKRKTYQKINEEVKKNTDDIQNIKSDISEIKNILIALLNKGQ